MPDVLEAFPLGACVTEEDGSAWVNLGVGWMKVAEADETEGE